MENNIQSIDKPNVSTVNVVRIFIKKQTVKNKINELQCQVGNDLYRKLDEFIENTLVRASQRTHGNKRRTVRGIDL